MSSLSTASDSPSSLLRTLLSLFSLSRLGALLDLYQLIRQWLPGKSDPYEFLEYESTLELLDRSGKSAFFQKRQKVKFLQDHIIAFEDYAWGDGNVMVDYRCSPGVIVDHYHEGGGFANDDRARQWRYEWLWMAASYDGVSH